MISDLALGILAASTVALALIVATVASLLIWLGTKLSAYTDFSVTKNKAGKVRVEAEVKP